MGRPGVGAVAALGTPGRGAAGIAGIAGRGVPSLAAKSALGGTTGRATGCPANGRALVAGAGPAATTAGDPVDCANAAGDWRASERPSDRCRWITGGRVDG